MNITLPSGQRRVHWQREGSPACGGGRHGKKGLWQLDLSEVTCRRCLCLAEAAQRKAAREAPPPG
jgi:hypothetical protein